MTRQARRSVEEWREEQLVVYRLHCLGVAAVALQLDPTCPAEIVGLLRSAYSMYRRHAASQALGGELPPHPRWLTVRQHRHAPPDWLVAEGVRSAPPATVGGVYSRPERGAR